MSYLTLSSQEKHLFYSVNTFTRIRQHYFFKYWGDQCIGRTPTSNFGRDRPPSPPRSPPLVEYYKMLNKRWVINETIVSKQKRSSIFFENCEVKFLETSVTKKFFRAKCLKVRTGTYFLTKKPWIKR